MFSQRILPDESPQRSHTCLKSACCERAAPQVHPHCIGASLKSRQIFTGLCEVLQAGRRQPQQTHQPESAVLPYLGNWLEVLPLSHSRAVHALSMATDRDAARVRLMPTTEA